MNRLELRNLVRFYLDDQNTDEDARWSDADINRALEFASEQVTTSALVAGYSNPLVTTVDSVLTNGHINLVPYKDVIAVFLNPAGNGSAMIKLSGGSKQGRTLTGFYSGTPVEVDLVLENSFPDNDVDPVLYCGVTPRLKTFDQVVALTAAQDLDIIEWEARPKLDAALVKLTANLFSGPTPPRVRARTLSNTWRAAMQRQTLNLVWFEDSAGVLGVTLP